MTDIDSFKRRKRAPVAKKYIKKYGGQVYIEMGLKGFEKRKEIMKKNRQEIVYNTRFAKDKEV